MKDDEIRKIARILLDGKTGTNGAERGIWLDPEDALEMAADIYNAGYRPLMGDK